MSTPPTAPTPTADQKLFIADKPKWSLVGLGLLLLILFAVGVVFARWVGSEVVETTSPTSTSATATVAKTTETKPVPSDTVLTAVLATGAALMLVGVLYYRITTIKLPGGAEIGLTEKEQKAAEKKVEKELEGKPEAEVAQATHQALTEVRREKERLGVLEFQPRVVRHLADEAISDFK